MKSRQLARITAITLFALALPVQLAAQQHSRYKLIDLGTLGGPNSFVEAAGDLPVVLNNRGTVVGCADTSTPDPDFPNFSALLSPPAPDPFIFHAFQWRNGALIDLGALPGTNSSCATWISGSGIVTGMSTSGIFDPVFGGLAAHAVLWKRGEIIDLGTLGGASSLALGVNDQGQVAGSATNAISQLRAFVWQKGVMHDLGTLGGPGAFATSINERGQVAGCASTDPINQHAFLWENGRMIDLGNFGGTYSCVFLLNNHTQVMGQATLPGDQVVHAFFGGQRGLVDLGNFGGKIVEPFWLNEQGEVVGGADYPGDTIRHAFLWKKGAMSDLGTLYPTCGSIFTGSVALGINSSSQIVGNSWCDNTAAAAFLWENGGPMVDLNTLIPSNSDMYLFGAQNINDRGEISGLGFLPETGDVHGFLLVPCGNLGENGCGQGNGAMAEIAPRTRVILPEKVSDMIRQQLTGRDHFPGLGTPTPRGDNPRSKP
jgi:probable HAF family extracellular repeat protein